MVARASLVSLNSGWPLSEREREREQIFNSICNCPLVSGKKESCNIDNWARRRRTLSQKSKWRHSECCCCWQAQLWKRKKEKEGNEWIPLFLSFLQQCNSIEYGWNSICLSKWASQSEWTKGKEKEHDHRLRVVCIISTSTSTAAAAAAASLINSCLQERRQRRKRKRRQRRLLLELMSSSSGAQLNSSCKLMQLAVAVQESKLKWTALTVPIARLFCTSANSSAAIAPADHEL